MDVSIGLPGLGAGWYELSIPVGGSGEGHWTADRIRATGTDEQPVALSSRSCGIRTIVLFPYAATRVELRVFSAHGGVVRPSVVFRRTGRLQAFGVMLRMIASSEGGVPDAGVALAEFFSGTAIYGLSAGAEGLHARYQAVIAGGASVASPPGQIWRLRRRIWWLRSDRLKLTQAPSAASGNPRFTVTRLDGASPILKAGWYRLTGQLKVGSGSVTAPRFELNYAEAQSKAIKVLIREPASRGRFDALVLFTRDVTALRFDLSSGPLQFSMRGFELRRMGRLEWMLRLLVRQYDEDGVRDWAGALRTGVHVVRFLFQGQVRTAGELLARRYLQAGLHQEGSYGTWVRRYDTISPTDRAEMERRGTRLAVNGPLISILVPVYQTPERWLRACLDSVLNQAYPKWELCIADDASPDPRIRELLTEYQRRDERIRVVFRDANGHISEASNSALTIARGDFVGLLDHDDELRPHALLEVAEAITKHPGLGLLYSDEDKIDADGRRFHPYFKPDWNPDLLLSQNYVCHFTVIRTTLVRNVGGFRKGFEGSQDHDLILRCARELESGQIHHVPKVLYHWRAIAGSTALERDSKDYAAAAGARAVAEHVRTIDPQARVEELPHGHYRVRWPVPRPAPKVSIIIPTRDRAELLRTCVESVLAKTRYPDFELVVVDNRSSELGALAYLDELGARKRVRVLRYDAEFNYSAINNWAAGQCDGRLLCLLNNDVEVIDADWLVEMVGFACRPETGAVGAMLYYPDGTIQHAGVILGVGGVANHAYCHEQAGYPGHGARALVAQNLSAVTGACLLVRRKVYEQVGGLDERLRVAFNDIDFCLKLGRAGYRNVWTPFARLYHHESASRGADDTEEKVSRFRSEVSFMRERWASVLDNDPAYNPNLSLHIGETSSQLAFPPRPGRGLLNLPMSGSDNLTVLAEAEVRDALTQAGARVRHRGKADAGVDVVLFWKQNDSTLYGRRSDMVARYLASRPDVRQVLVVDAPIGRDRLVALAASTDPLHHARQVAERTLEKLAGSHDTRKLGYTVFVHPSEGYGTDEQDRPSPAFLSAYEAFLRGEFTRWGIDPERALFWIYPRNFSLPPLVERFSPLRVVVDVVDDHRAWPGVREAEKTRLSEHYRALLERADLALANCAPVRDAMASLGHSPLLVPNGCDMPLPVDLEYPDEALQEQLAFTGPTLGFVGNLEAKIDIALLSRLAEAFPDCRLVLIGSTHANPDVLTLGRHPNVRLPGVVPYDRLGAWLSTFDVGLIPHREMDLTLYMNPLKAYVYLANGVPVVATAVPNVDPVAGLLVQARDPDAFVAAVAACLQRGRPAPGEFKTVAASHSWAARLGPHLDALRLASIGKESK